MTQFSRSSLLIAALAASMAGTALAGGGDNGMNPFHGDSWAALQGNGSNLGGEASLPGAGAAYTGTEPHDLQSMHKQVPQAQASTAYMSQPAQSSPRTRTNGPATTTQVDPFADKGGS